MIYIYIYEPVVALGILFRVVIKKFKLPQYFS